MCWPVIKESGLFYAGADRREDGEKVESAKERRAVPSRVTHAATRMTDDERLILVDQFLWFVKDHQPR